jgi:hypothetical protein
MVAALCFVRPGKGLQHILRRLELEYVQKFCQAMDYLSEIATVVSDVAGMDEEVQFSSRIEGFSQGQSIDGGRDIEGMGNVGQLRKNCFDSGDRVANVLLHKVLFDEEYLLACRRRSSSNDVRPLRVAEYTTFYDFVL